MNSIKPRFNLNKFFILSVLILILTLTPNRSTAHEVFIGRLDNGMDVVLIENHSVPMIACNIVIRAGARDETWETWGAAHFLEHLLFNGTVDRTQEEIYAEFDRIGAYHNAHTGSHFVDFMLLVSKDNFQAGFEILADMVFNSNLPPWKYKKECGIVKEEIAQSKAMGDADDQLFREALFSDSPLSRSVLGTVESIDGVQRDSVLAFYKRWYVPNNMLLFATGNFSSDTLFDWFQEELSQYQPRELPPRRKIAAPDFNSLNGLGIVHRQVERRNRKVFLAMNAPAPGHPDYPAFTLLQTVLERRLEVNLPPGSSGGGYLLNDPDLTIYQLELTSPADGPSAAVLVSSLDKIVSDLADNPPDQAEISRLARSYRADRIFNAEMLNHYGIMYADIWALISWYEFASLPDRMAELTPSELREVVKKWLLGADRFIISLEPALKMERAAVDTARSIERFQIEDGPALIVRSDSSAQVFALHVLVKNRWLFDREFGTGAVDILHQLLDESSDRKKSITERLDDLAARLKVADNPNIPFDNYYTTPDYSYIRLEILPDRWREGIELVADLMTDVPFTEEALRTAREQTTAAALASSRSSVNQGRSRLRVHLFPGTALSAMVYGDASELSPGDLKRLKESYFQAQNLIITAAGPVNSEDVREAVSQAFRKLPSSGSSPPDFTPLSPPDVTGPDDDRRDTLSLGKTQGAVVMGRVIPQIVVSDRAALIVANAYFNNRMGDVLRETLGLAYSLGSSLGLHRGDNGEIWGYWEMYIATRQENLERAEEGINDLVQELSEHRFSETEVEKLRNAIKGRLMMRSMSRISQAYAMGIGEFYWSDPSYRDKIINEIRHVTASQVEESARKYMKAAKMATVIVE